MFLYYFGEYVCNRNPKMRTKISKNYISILAIVNRCNWLEASTPLILEMSAIKNDIQWQQ